ncbi:hypothetical protein ACSTS3_19720 [Aquimarina muelleri]|uniref:hypothetical protein n=1 Tax=Aquimarina muelleri TaxID=279356 RepID=UPI003F6851AE
MKPIVIYNQNLLDIAIQEYGTPHAVFDLAVTNDLSITDDLKEGISLELTKNSYETKEVADYYKKKRLRPATATKTIIDNQASGIGIMQVNNITNTFKVG